MLVADFLEAFRRGKQVADPATWKNRAVAVDALSGLLIAAFAIAKGFGYDLPVTADTIELASSCLVTLVLAGNAVVHVVSSRTVGLPPRAADARPRGVDRPQPRG